MRFQQIKEDRLDFGGVVIPIRNSTAILEVPDEYKDHPEVARALKVDSLRVLETPAAPTEEETSEPQTPKKRKGE